MEKITKSLELEIKKYSKTLTTGKLLFMKTLTLQLLDLPEDNVDEIINNQKVLRIIEEELESRKN